MIFTYDGQNLAILLDRGSHITTITECSHAFTATRPSSYMDSSKLTLRASNRGKTRDTYWGLSNPLPKKYQPDWIYI